MKKGESSQIEALEALIAEKRKLEGYLAKLDERREGTPEHVYSRLRDEYLTKLTDTQIRAHAEAETISGGLDEDDDAIREIEGRLAAFKEEKVEGELRAVVGELDAKEWAKKLTTLNASISLAEKELDARTSAVERTRSMLAEAKGTAAGAPRSPGDSAAKESKDAKDAKDAKKPGMTGAPSFDELAFLNSVVGRTTGSIPSVPPSAQNASKPVEQLKAESAQKPARTSTPPATPSAPPAAPIAPAERTSGQGVTEERVPAAKRATPAVPAAAAPVTAPATAPATAKSSTEQSGEAAKSAEVARASSAAPAASSSPAATTPATAPAAAPTAARAAPDAPAMEAAEPALAEPDAFGRPTPRSSQAVKTLKCQECGTFNFPTEWYCERCGGELAAL